MPESNITASDPRPANNFTPTPNILYQKWKRDLSGPELKVWMHLYYITNKHCGYAEPYVRITQQGLADECGLHRNTLMAALRGLTRRKLIARFEFDGKMAYCVYWAVSDEDSYDAQNMCIDENSDAQNLCKEDDFDAQNLCNESDSDSSLISKEKKLKEGAPLSRSDSSSEPPHPIPEMSIPEMPMEIGTVRWLEQEARRHGLSVRFNSAKRRSAVEGADSPLWREKVSRRLAELDRAGEKGNQANEILRLAGREISPRTRSGGFSAPTPPARGRSLPQREASRQNQPLEKPPPTAFAARITRLLRAWIDVSAAPAPWEWAKLERLWLRDPAKSQKWDEKLAEFANARPDASLSAIVLAFLDEHSETPRQAKRRSDEEEIEAVRQEFLATGKH